MYQSEKETLSYNDNVDINIINNKPYDWKLVKKLIENSYLSQNEFLILVGYDSNYIKSSIPFNKYVTSDILQMLIKEDDWKIRYSIIFSEKITPEILDSLSYDECVYVQHSVACHEKTPLKTLERMCEVCSWSVKYRLIQNLNIKTYILDYLSKDNNPFIRESIATSDKVSLNSLELLYNDDSFHVRKAVACNKKTPSYILSLLYNEFPNEVLTHNNCPFTLKGN